MTKCHIPGCTAAIGMSQGRPVCLEHGLVKTDIVAATRMKKNAADPDTYKSEADLVQWIKKALENRGWLIYRIGQHIVKGSGSDPGVPDILCVYPAMPPHPAIIRLFEVKFGKNSPTEDQQKLIDAGGSHEIRSVRQALIICGYPDDSD